MKAILYILSILLCLNLEGQELERLNSIPLKAQADFIQVDQFGSIYLVLDMNCVSSIIRESTKPAIATPCKGAYPM